MIVDDERLKESDMWGPCMGHSIDECVHHLISVRFWTITCLVKDVQTIWGWASHFLDPFLLLFESNPQDFFTMRGECDEC